MNMAVKSGDDEHHGSAFAPQEETWRAIRNVMELRHKYIESKCIADLGHVLTPNERGELTKGVRDEHEATEEQRVLQDKYVERGKAKGKWWTGNGAAGDDKGSRTRGARQLAKGKGKA